MFCRVSRDGSFARVCVCGACGADGSGNGSAQVRWESFKGTGAPLMMEGWDGSRDCGLGLAELGDVIFVLKLAALLLGIQSTVQYSIVQIFRSCRLLGRCLTRVCVCVCVWQAGREQAASEQEGTEVREVYVRLGQVRRSRIKASGRRESVWLHSFLGIIPGHHVGPRTNMMFLRRVASRRELQRPPGPGVPGEGRHTGTCIL